jgi:hypothetical protein
MRWPKAKGWLCVIFIINGRKVLIVQLALDCRFWDDRLSAESFEQCFRLFQIGSVEAFGEPVVDVGEHDARLVWVALLDDKAGEALRCAHLPRLRAHGANERESPILPLAHTSVVTLLAP